MIYKHLIFKYFNNKFFFSKNLKLLNNIYNIYNILMAKE